jgi:hypothetical protein
MKRILLYLPLLSLFSCTPKITTINSFDILEQGHQLNHEYTTEMGEKMIEKITGKVYNAIVINEDHILGNSYGIKEIKKGDVFLNKAVMPEYDLYYPQTTEQKTGAIAINKQDGTVKILYAGYNLYNLQEPFTFSKTQSYDLFQPYFKQQFIYNGKSGNSIKFTYREFSCNIARPSFTQDLTYDLSEGNTIGFKGMRIDVSKATNVNISYKIIKPFE